MVIRMDRTDVVTAFLRNKQGRVLLLRRSDDVRTYRGHWAAVSGYLETTDPLLQAEIELREETGLSRGRQKLEKRGDPLTVDDPEGDQYWRVHPFRFRLLTDAGDITLDREHSDYEWRRPDEVGRGPTVPGLRKAWERVSDE